MSCTGELYCGRSVCPFFGDIRFVFGELATLTPPVCPGVRRPMGLAESEWPTRQKRTNCPQKTDKPPPAVQLTSTAHPKCSSAASGASKRLIKGSPGPFRPAHTPWGYCDRLGWLVVACGCHPQPSRRPRALKVAAAGSGQRRRGGVLRVTWVTTTGIRGVGRGPITSARATRHSYRVVEHEFYEKLKKN